MRRLLLLLLTFLLPLQLLAATVADLPPRAGEGGAALSCQHVNAPAFAHVEAAAVADAASDQLTGQPDDDTDDAPAPQAELEDHTLPARIATPDIPWQPFPHAFAAPLSWPSFVRDQLRPPPLA